MKSKLLLTLLLGALCIGFVLLALVADDAEAKGCVIIDDDKDTKPGPNPNEPDIFPTEDDNDDEEEEKRPAWNCFAQRKKCCKRYMKEMLTDPMGFEKKTGCRLECCRQPREPGQPQTGMTKLPRRAVSRQLLNNIFGCVTELIINLTQFRLSLPDSCCRLPLVSFLCGSQPPAPQPQPRPPGPRPPGPDNDYPNPPDRPRSLIENMGDLFDD